MSRMSRSSRASTARESVFKRPAHLDALVANVEAGRSSNWDRLDEEAEDEGSDDWDGGVSSLRSRDRGDSYTAGLLEDAQREAEVLRGMNDHMHKQLKGCMAELELHRSHAEDYKRMLEAAEEDICHVHEMLDEKTIRLETAKMALERNDKAAAKHASDLHTAHTALKAMRRRNAELDRKVRSSGGDPGFAAGPAAASAAAASSGRDPDEELSEAAISALIPIAHDVDVQCDLRPSSRGSMRASGRSYDDDGDGSSGGSSSVSCFSCFFGGGQRPVHAHAHDSRRLHAATREAAVQCEPHFLLEVAPSAKLTKGSSTAALLAKRHARELEGFSATGPPKELMMEARPQAMGGDGASGNGKQTV